METTALSARRPMPSTASGTFGLREVASVVALGVLFDVGQLKRITASRLSSVGMIARLAFRGYEVAAAPDDPARS
jgi:hypothetical protein